jgi:hypothetical protein
MHVDVPFDHPPDLTWVVSWVNFCKMWKSSSLPSYKFDVYLQVAVFNDQRKAEGLHTFMGMMAAAAPTASEVIADGAGISEVRLPPRYALRRSHVVDALKGVPADARDVTVWIHSSTLGIEMKCFRS